MLIHKIVDIFMYVVYTFKLRISIFDIWFGCGSSWVVGVILCDTLVVPAAVSDNTSTSGTVTRGGTMLYASSADQGRVLIILVY